MSLNNERSPLEPTPDALTSALADAASATPAPSGTALQLDHASSHRRRVRLLALLTVVFVGALATSFVSTRETVDAEAILAGLEWQASLLRNEESALGVLPDSLREAIRLDPQYEYQRLGQTGIRLAVQYDDGLYAIEQADRTAPLVRRTPTDSTP